MDWPRWDGNRGREQPKTSQRIPETEEESNYQQRIAQLVVQHTLPTTGVHVTTTSEDMYTLSKLVLWQGLVDAPDRVGLFVSPNFSIDMYYMCIG